MGPEVARRRPPSQVGQRNQHRPTRVPAPRQSQQSRRQKKRPASPLRRPIYLRLLGPRSLEVQKGRPSQRRPRMSWLLPALKGRVGGQRKRLLSSRVQHRTSSLPRERRQADQQRGRPSLRLQRLLRRRHRLPVRRVSGRLSRKWSRRPGRVPPLPPRRQSRSCRLVLRCHRESLRVPRRGARSSAPQLCG